MSEAPDFLLEAGTRGAKVSPDQLARLRDVAKKLWSKQTEAGELEERVKATKAEIVEIERRELVDLMTEVGVDKIGIGGEGNQPAYDAQLKPYYRANIAASWPPEKQARAFDYLEEEGHGDLIKLTVSVSFGKGDIEKARDLEKIIRASGYEPTTGMSVPWNTLTAWLREQIEKYGRMPPLELIGGDVGHIVKLTNRKT